MPKIVAVLRPGYVVALIFQKTKLVELVYWVYYLRIRSRGFGTQKV